MLTAPIHTLCSKLGERDSRLVIGKSHNSTGGTMLGLCEWQKERQIICVCVRVFVCVFLIQKNKFLLHRCAYVCVCAWIRHTTTNGGRRLTFTSVQSISAFPRNTEFSAVRVRRIILFYQRKQTHTIFNTLRTNVKKSSMYRITSISFKLSLLLSDRRLICVRFTKLFSFVAVLSFICDWTVWWAEQIRPLIITKKKSVSSNIESWCGWAVSVNVLEYSEWKTFVRQSANSKFVEVRGYAGPN